MKISKCDRCGAKIVPKVNRTWLVTKTITHAVSVFHHPDNSTAEEEYDLCECCYNGLEEWLGKR